MAIHDRLFISMNDFYDLFGYLDYIAYDNLMITGNDANALRIMWNFIKPIKAVEFGINEGKTAQILLNEGFVKEYIGIDIPSGEKPSLKFQYKETPLKPGRVVEKDSRVKIILSNTLRREKCLTNISDVDFVFIDGDHSIEGVLNDSLLAINMVNKGAIICWHDYSLVSETTRVLLYLNDVKKWNIRHIEGTFICFMLIE